MSKISTLTFTQTLEHLEGYRGVARVRDIAPVAFDEPRELGGEDSAPCPMDYLLTAVGGCLMSSLALCLQKKRVDARLTMEVSGRVERNEEGLLAVAGIEADIRVQAPDDQWKKVEGCYQVFKKYCIVSASVARGIPLETRLLRESGDG
ncbi:MAG: hypothetical protein Kow0092_14200 [Deferrisomatales bacterium]